MDHHSAQQDLLKGSNLLSESWVCWTQEAGLLYVGQDSGLEMPA